MRNTVDLGWGDCSIPEQFPELDSGLAQHFDKDKEAINRLSLRSVLTHSQAEAARKKLVKKISAAVVRARTQGGGNG